MSAPSKIELRAAMRKLRRELPPHERRDREALATAHALDLVHSRNARAVALFHSTPEEISTHALIESLLADGIAVALPRVTPDGLEFRRITSLVSSLQLSAFGVMEPDPAACPLVIQPSSFDIIFTPGLAFDRRGQRLGYGKGHYDRVLHAAGPRALLAGFAFDFQVVDIIPEESHDIPMGAVVTDEGVIRVSRF